MGSWHKASTKYESESKSNRDVTLSAIINKK